MDMKQIIKSTLILVAITLIAGLALAVVYQVTKEPIAEAEAAAALRAYNDVFPGETFEEIDLKAFDGTEKEIPESKGVTVDKIVAVVGENGAKGYALTVASPNGYGGNITLAMGVSPDGTLIGISIISQGETAGLGANCTTSEFTSQFAGITGGRVVYTKNGKTAQNEIDALSGATVTTRAVTAAVNVGLAYVQTYHMPEGGEQS